MREDKEQRLSEQRLSLVRRYAEELVEANDSEAREWPREALRMREERDREFAEVVALAEAEADR